MLDLVTRTAGESSLPMSQMSERAAALALGGRVREGGGYSNRRRARRINRGDSLTVKWLKN